MLWRPDIVRIKKCNIFPLRFRYAAITGGRNAGIRLGDHPDPCRRKLTNYIGATIGRSEEHTSELQSLMRTSYAVFCLKTKTTNLNPQHTHLHLHSKQKQHR